MAPTSLHLGGACEIGLHRPTLVVAELGQNHNGQLALAEQLIDAAAWAGADAVKLTKRDLHCDLSAEARQKPYTVPQSFGPTYGEHRAALELSVAEYRHLAQRARRRGLLFFATACDIPSADLLHDLGVEFFKVASRDLNNLPLLQHLAQFDRPIFLSTGMSDFAEIDRAVEAIRCFHDKLVLLQCTSLYPTPWHEAHLRSVPALARRYRTLVGFSDHSPGVLLPPVAVAMGAVVVEKHLTLDRAMKGTDHACSLEPQEFHNLVENIRQVEAALGSDQKPQVSGVPEVRKRLGRSLVARVSVAAGTRIDETMLTLKCPGDGISWLQRGDVIGRCAARDIQADQKLTIEDLC